MRNPRAKNYKQLGLSTQQWTAAIKAVVDYLDAHDDEGEIDDATLRALHPALADAGVWNEVRRELGAE